MVYIYLSSLIDLLNIMLFIMCVEDIMRISWTLVVWLLSDWQSHLSQLTEYHFSKSLMWNFFLHMLLRMHSRIWFLCEKCKLCIQSNAFKRIFTFFNWDIITNIVDVENVVRLCWLCCWFRVISLFFKNFNTMCFAHIKIFKKITQ